ncbi:GntR family transcriptional regulator [uncultured Enterovirga sp.]|uniref:GntR family transcriptional regulator n=1 Tax=uncultured Enterovirga sp. TaxID=2026352 RepID=UPI0035CA3D87
MPSSIGIHLDTCDGQRLPRTLASAIAERLRGEILTAVLLPGQKLHIAILAKRFSVSLAAVREALSRLVTDGIVQSLDQRGFRVSPVSSADLRDLTRTRIEIEGLALRRAMAEGGPEWEAAVESAFAALSVLPRLGAEQPERHNEAWASQHRRFHQALVGACGSAWLLRLRHVLYEQSERYRRLSIPLETRERDVEAEHLRLMEAALARDESAALAALAEHFQRTTDIILAADVALLREPLAA